MLYELKAIKEAMTVHDEKSGVTKTIPITRIELVESQIEEKSFRKVDDIIKFEEALIRVQDKKIKAIELKAHLLDEERQVRIEKLKFELQMLRGGKVDDTKDDGFIEALRGRTAEVWADGKTKLKPPPFKWQPFSEK